MNIQPPLVITNRNNQNDKNRVILMMKETLKVLKTRESTNRPKNSRNFYYISCKWN